jgi:CRISPR-associated endonuclease Csn1
MDWISQDPYQLRKTGTSQALEPHELGRVLYHLNQRRGYNSNRKDQSSADETGKVLSAINELSEQIGNRTYGEYFAGIDPHQATDRIRGRYTLRQTYEQEYDKIMSHQKLSAKEKAMLREIIYDQRDLRSQKGLLGNCRFEPKKTKSPLSRPCAEEYRSLSLINNLKVVNGDAIISLTDNDRTQLLEATYRATDFTMIKWLKLLRDTYGDHIQINYDEDTKIKASRTINYLTQFLGIDWRTWTHQRLTYEDIWHIWYAATDEQYLRLWGAKHLSLTGDELTKFAKVKLAAGFSNLSKKAMENINYFLRKGYLHQDAVFLAKIPELLGAGYKKAEDTILKEIDGALQQMRNHNGAVRVVNGLIKKFRMEKGEGGPDYPYDDNDTRDVHDAVGTTTRDLAEYAETLYKQQLLTNRLPRYVKSLRLMEVVTGFLNDNFPDSQNHDLLYHPSMTDVYEQVEEKLDEPFTSSFRNPMAMRMMQMLKKLINQLIHEGKIYSSTQVVVEVARELNSANYRAALRTYQRNREKENDSYRQELIKAGVSKPDSRWVKKYRLWLEQDRTCLYTGKSIPLTALIEGTDFDLEHTLPRSKTFNNELSNLTLCHKAYNSKVKDEKIPTECPNYEAETSNWPNSIKNTVDHTYGPRLEAADKAFRVAKRRKENTSDPEAKDRAIQRYHLAKMEKDYWKEKMATFTITEISSRWKNSQLRDTQMITRYSIAYLKSYFKRVYSFKGGLTNVLGKAWNVIDDTKDRSKHSHHAVDAALLTCMVTSDRCGLSMLYDQISQAYREVEHYDYAVSVKKLKIDKPWDTVTEDLKNYENEVLIYHHDLDRTFRQTKKRLKRGGFTVKAGGKQTFKQGKGVRGKLHKETHYRAIVNNDGKVRYAYRKKVTTLELKDLKNIVDQNLAQQIIASGLSEIKSQEHLVQQVLQIKTIEGKKNINEIKSEEDALRLLPDSNHWKAQILEIIREGGIKQLHQNGLQRKIKAVRVFANDVKSPIELKRNPYPAKIEAREQVLVKNESNYCMALYRSDDGKKRGMQVISLMDAATYYRHNDFKVTGIVSDTLSVVSRGKEHILPLTGVIKRGTMLILKSKDTDTINWDNDTELLKRLYVVIGISSYMQGSNPVGEIMLKHAMIASPSSLLKRKKGEFSLSEYHPLRHRSHTNLNAAIENIDFKVSITGQIVNLT